MRTSWWRWHHLGKKIDKTGRSKTRKHDTFVALELFILHSEAWGSLSLAARQAYIEIAALYDQTNNGNLALSARQLAERLSPSVGETPGMKHYWR